MSILEDFFPSDGKVAKHLVLVNSDQEFVVINLDDKNRAVDFICGDFEDTLCRIYNKDAICNMHSFVIKKSLELFSCKTNAELCEKLNCNTENVQKHLLNIYPFRVIIDDFVRFNELSKKWEPLPF